MAVLYIAFRYVDRHAGDYECIEISGDRVRIETREGRAVQQVELNRHWARVVMTDGAGVRGLRSAPMDGRSSSVVISRTKSGSGWRESSGSS